MTSLRIIPAEQWTMKGKFFVWGPPKTGKTHFALELATKLAAGEKVGHRYDTVRAYMHKLGPRSILVDLRLPPDTHLELRRRQRLKRNTFTWPQDRAAQCLHPIELRNAFGMRYRHISSLQHGVHVGCGGTDATLARQAKVWLTHPAGCNQLVTLIQQRCPLLVIDEQPDYEISLRRAVILHLLALFEKQLDMLPETI